MRELLNARSWGLRQVILAKYTVWSSPCMKTHHVKSTYPDFTKTMTVNVLSSIWCYIEVVVCFFVINFRALQMERASASESRASGNVVQQGRTSVEQQILEAMTALSSLQWITCLCVLCSQSRKQQLPAKAAQTSWWDCHFDMYMFVVRILFCHTNK